MLHIGKIIKELRIKNNMSQKDIADLLLMDISYFSKIERGKRNILDENLVILSQVFNVNLIDIRNSFNNFQTFDDYQNYYLLREFIENKDIESIDNWLNINDSLLNYGEPLLLKTYCIALVNSIKFQEYKKSNILCFNTLDLTANPINHNIKNNKYTNSSYSMLVLITYNYIKLEEYDVGLAICQEIMPHYDYLLTNKSFLYLNHSYLFKKTYIAFLNNYIYILLKKNHFTQALEFCNSAISKAISFNILNQLHSLQGLKFEILYNLNDITNAQNTYNQLKIFCEITQNKTFLIDTHKLILEQYPLITI